MADNKGRMILRAFPAVLLIVLTSGCLTGGQGPSSIVSSGGAATPVVSNPTTSDAPAASPTSVSSPSAASDSGPGVLGPVADPERVLPTYLYATIYYGDGFSQTASNMLDGYLPLAGGTFTLPLRFEIRFFDGVRETMNGPIPAGGQVRLVLEPASGTGSYYYRDVKSLALQPEGYNAVFKDLTLPPGDWKLSFFVGVNVMTAANLPPTFDYNESLTPMSNDDFGKFMMSGWGVMSGNLLPTAAPPSDSR